MSELMALGEPTAPVLVVCDSPHPQAFHNGFPIAGGDLQKFAEIARAHGLAQEDFYFVSPCDPIPEEAQSSDKREGEFIAPFRETLLQVIGWAQPRMILSMGNVALRQLIGRKTPITKARGQWRTHLANEISVPLLPTLSPKHVLNRPEAAELFETDMRILGEAKMLGWSVPDRGDVETHYEYCLDLATLIAFHPTSMSVDTEATGLDWHKGDVELLTVQLCYEEGRTLVVPLHCGWYPGLTQRKRAKLIQQLRILLEDPTIRKACHNGKFDRHLLLRIGIDMQSTTAETQQLAHSVDENMLIKNLDECTRRWVPAMAGYADAFNQTHDKSRMIDVSPEDLLPYAGGDADATFRLAKRLIPLCQQDQGQWDCYNLIQLPALHSFGKMEERGVAVDKQALSELGVFLGAEEQRIYNELIAETPAEVRRAHMAAGKALRFSRADFVRDILFTPEGFNLTPTVFTNSTKNLPPDQRVASTSVKDHLGKFNHIPYVVKLIGYQKLQKMRTTYVGHEETEEEPATGFFQYIWNDEIHPSFRLDVAVTGRTASQNPNGQNLPKRGEYAKQFRRVFVARPGYVLLEGDLSQVELRVAAWMANEITMLEIYARGGDIHAATAAAVMRLTIEQFFQLPKEERDLKRFYAKAVNFGFLFSMWWRTFMVYAKVEYGIDYTEAEAQHVRTTFFETYPGLVAWHDRMRREVARDGYVKALHGATRHLQNVHSADDAIRGMAERQGINSPVQRFGSDLGIIALNRFTRDADPDIARPVLFIHDALVVEAKEEHALEVAANLKWYMETPPLEAMFGLTPPIPFPAEVSIGANLADAEELDGLVAVMPDWAQPHLDLAA